MSGFGHNPPSPLSPSKTTGFSSSGKGWLPPKHSSPKMKTAEMEQSWMNKRVAEDGNVPFSPGSRNVKDDAHDRMNTLTKTTYGWKAPTYFK